MIALVLLVMLAVGGVSHAALLAAREEVAASALRGRDLGLRMEAEQVLARALDDGLGSLLRSLPPWGEDVLVDSLAAVPARVRVRRLAPEVGWARAEVHAHGMRRRSAGRLLWTLEPGARLRAIDAAVTVAEGAPVLVDGLVETGRWAAADPPLDAALCAAALAALATGTVPPVSTLPPADALRPGLGLLAFDSLLARTPVGVEGSGSPEPTEAGGACRMEEPWGWGDPDRPWRPCGAHFAVRAAAGDLRVEGGSGQGALVVDGDLTLTDGARFHGLVVATGMLRLRGGAELHGAAIAAGGLEVGAGSRVVGSACPVHRALASASIPWGARPVEVPGVGAVGP